MLYSTPQSTLLLTPYSYLMCLTPHFELLCYTPYCLLHFLFYVPFSFLWYYSAPLRVKLVFPSFYATFLSPFCVTIILPFLPIPFYVTLLPTFLCYAPVYLSMLCSCLPFYVMLLPTFLCYAPAHLSMLCPCLPFNVMLLPNFLCYAPVYLSLLCSSYLSILRPFYVMLLPTFL